ncbi:hypothetical protein GOBAR_DD02444 [Gossypium barbadense]|nr:hypothetical protein GOBAR_DD02444 [Gossypium barbadense]
MEVDTRTNEREQTAELKSTTVAKEINMEETNIGSQHAAACSDAPDSIEYDLRKMLFQLKSYIQHYNSRYNIPSTPKNRRLMQRKRQQASRNLATAEDCGGTGL